MFVDNAHPSLAHHMTMNCLQTYKDIKQKGMILEQGLIKDGIIKIYKKTSQDQSYSNDKSQYCNKNMNIVTDGATDTRHINILGATQQPSYQQSAPPQKNYQQHYQQHLQQTYQPNTSTPYFQGPPNQANSINIATRRKPKFPKPSRTFTSLGEPLDVIFEKLAKDNLICYPPTQQNEQNQSKASWYKPNEY